MPYKVSKQGDQYVVYKKDTGKRVGATDANKESLRKYLAALHINANEVLLKEEDEKQIAANLTKAFNAGPAATRDYLNGPEGSSEEARALLLKPAAPEDGSDEDDKVKVGDASGQAMGYKPTQNYIDLMQSVAWPLGSAKNLIDAINSGPTAKGIVVSKDLIIDGHHRWSGAIAIGGANAKIQGKNVEWPGDSTNQILAAAQLTIAAKLGPGKKQPSAGGGAATNILGKSAEAIYKMIIANLGKQTDKNAPGPLLNKAMCYEILKNPSMLEAINKWTGESVQGLKEISVGMDAVQKLRKSIAKKIANNLAKLPQNPEAPDRPDMPQFDPKRGGPELDTVTGDLAAGKFNVSPPFIKESKLRTLLRRVIKEEVNKRKK
jgi:hypothetical protein